MVPGRIRPGNLFIASLCEIGATGGRLPGRELLPRPGEGGVHRVRGVVAAAGERRRPERARLDHQDLDPERRDLRPGLSWVPLTDVEPLRVALAWADGGPLVEAFAAIVRALAGVRRTSAASPRPR
ncbi:hypothetical protein GCM10010187_23380 [Actinomadura coerulea]|nr:hypothetical protein GCM10010187_23380 [Actinomadura coerulea]